QPTGPCPTSDRLGVHTEHGRDLGGRQQLVGVRLLVRHRDTIPSSCASHSVRASAIPFVLAGSASAKPCEDSGISATRCRNRQKPAGGTDRRERVAGPTPDDFSP